MQTYRYSLTDSEIEAVANIAREIGPVQADHKLESKLLKCGPNWGKSNSYSVDLKRCDPGDAAVFQQLGLKLSKQIISAHPKPLVVLEKIPLELPAASLLLLGQMYGLVDEYLEDGAAIDTVTNRNPGNHSPSNSPSNSPSHNKDLRPRSTNNLRFPMHTDLSFSKQMPSTVYFLVVNPASEGGASLFCDVHDVLNDLSAETISALTTPYRFPAPPHRPDKAPLDAPILECHRGMAPSIRYRRDGLELLGTPAQRDRQSKALEEFEKAIEAHTVTTKLKSGELAIWRNRQILHGREAFRDTTNNANNTKKAKRLALRTYATTV